MYIKESIETYLNDLAARKPAPGGGSAAALNAAIGVALMQMVANYTVGDLKYKSVEPSVKAILAKLDVYRPHLQKLIDEDAEAYNMLSNKMKMLPKDSPGLDKAYQHASRPPFEICISCAECLKLCVELVECGNKNLITDTAIAAICLEGAFFAAKYNVYMNLKYIKDMDFIGEMHKVLQPLEEALPKLKEEILEKCEKVIR
jgi:formiminotetrahydrofolate cyclodeaminase